VGFVKTAEEIARIQAAAANPRFVNAEMLQISFLTDPATVARLLPPGLRPAARPVVSIRVGRWQSNCVADYEGGSVGIAARYGDIEANYLIGMYMSTEAPGYSRSRPTSPPIWGLRGRLKGPSTSRRYRPPTETV